MRERPEHSKENDFIGLTAESVGPASALGLLSDATATRKHIQRDVTGSTQTGLKTCIWLFDENRDPRHS